MEEKEKTSEAPETQETTVTTTKAVRLKNQTSRIYTLFVAVFVLLIAAGIFFAKFFLSPKIQAY